MPFALGIMNLLVGFVALGVIIYTKLVYKRISITEEKERDRLTTIYSKPPTAVAPGYIEFDPIQVNIESSPAKPEPADGTAQQLKGKMHYAIVTFVIEIRDASKKELFTPFRPLIVDRFLNIVGKMSLHELAQAHGRYLLRSQLIDIVNQLLLKQNPGASFDGLVTNVYFTQFLVE